MTPNPTPASIESLLAQARWLDALARRLVADPHEADDIVQETWIAALKHPPHASVPMRAWLARVARNFAIQRGRGESARKRREQNVAREESSTGDSAAIDRAQTHRRLVDAVLALGEPYRSTLVLHYFDQLSIAEIAARQSTPESTVRTRFSRAIGMLRARFRDEDGAEWSAAFLPLLSKAHPAPLTTATALSTTTLIGGIAMATAWKVGVSAAAAVLLAWWVWPAHTRAVVDLGSPAPNESPKEHLAATGSANDHTRVPLSSSEPTDLPSTSSSPLAGAPSLASLDVHVRWGDDGTSASGVVVRLNQWSAPDPEFDDTVALTDGDGQAHFDGVSAGAVRVTCDRAANELTRATAGEVTKVELTIPDGVDVDGLVMAENGTPVGDAHIVTTVFSPTGTDIARSDARGRFHLRDVDPHRALAAVREGFGPSGIRPLQPHAAGSRADLLFTLTTARQPVIGFVHDQAGHAIAGAKVHLQTAPRSRTNDAGISTYESFPKFEVLTDESGEFRASCIGTSRLTIEVDARGFVRWKQTVRDDRDGSAPIYVRLRAEAVVHGIVRDVAGAPVDAAYVTSEPTSEQGSSVYTRPDGTFRLQHVPSGSVPVHVIADDQGESRRTFQLAAGDDVEWNVQLESNPSVTGRVVDDGGKPLAGWLVGAIVPDQPGMFLRTAHTDATGEFTLGNWPVKATAVEARESNAMNGDAPALVTAIKAGDVDVVLKVDPALLHSAFLVGRLFDAEGRPAATTVLSWISEKTGSGQQVATNAEGRFRIGPLVPGAYALDIRVDGQAPKRIGGLQLAVSQVLDVGDIHLEHPGELVVHVHFPPGTDRRREISDLHLCNMATNESSVVPMHGDEGHRTSLAPGIYLVRLSSDTLQASYTRVAIEAEQRTELDLPLLPGTSRGVKLVSPKGAPKNHQVHLRVLDPAGRVICDDTYPGPLQSSIFLGGLGLGTYQVEASADDGPTVRANLDVETLEPTMKELELRLL